MNSLIKKGILVILILFFVTAAFSGCGANGTKTVSAPVGALSGQVPQNGGIQFLTSEGTTPETTEPETTEPEVTEPEATEPEATEPEATEPATDTAPAEEDFFTRFKAFFLKFFEWFRIRVNYVFDVLIKEA